MEHTYYSREYTKKEKLANWFYYNKWWLVVGAVLIWIVGTMLWNVLGVGKAKPDYRVAYVGMTRLSDSCVSALEEGLSALGTDLNGDGKVIVQLTQHITTASQNAEGMIYGYAAEVTVLADITEGESYFFLLDDPQSFQKNYQILAHLDGSMPENDDFEAMDKVYAWNSLPSLASIESEEMELLSTLYLGRRYFYDPSTAGDLSGMEAFWEILTRGAEE